LEDFGILRHLQTAHTCINRVISWAFLDHWRHCEACVKTRIDWVLKALDIDTDFLFSFDPWWDTPRNDKSVILVNTLELVWKFFWFASHSTLNERLSPNDDGVVCVPLGECDPEVTASWSWVRRAPSQLCVCRSTNNIWIWVDGERVNLASSSSELQFFIEGFARRSEKLPRVGGQRWIWVIDCIRELELELSACLKPHFSYDRKGLPFDRHRAFHIIYGVEARNIPVWIHIYFIWCCQFNLAIFGDYLLWHRIKFDLHSFLLYKGGTGKNTSPIESYKIK